MSQLGRGLAVSQLGLSLVIARKVIAGRGRRLLRLVVLFMVPAFVIGVASFAINALQLTPAQRAQHYMGSAAGVLLPIDVHFGDPTDVLRAGHGRVTADRYAVRLGQTVFVNGIERETRVWTADWTSPVPRSQWRLMSGRWPRGSREVAVTSASAQSLRVRPGQSIRMGGIGSTLLVVGIIEDPTTLDADALLGSPALEALLAAGKLSTSTTTSVGYLLSGPHMEVASVVNAAVRGGLAAYTRDQVSAVQARTLFRTQALTVTAPGVLLVVVLSASAFIVRVRRAGRQLAILMALGVRPATLVRASRMAAGWTALLGAVLGVLLAAALNLSMAPSLGRAAGHDVAVPALGLGSILLTLSIVVGSAVLAAWLPARVARRGAAKFDGSAPVKASRPLVGTAAAGVFALAVLTTVAVRGQTWVVAALVVAVCAALFLLPATLRLIAAITSEGRLLVRVSSRQVSRNFRRPAVAVAVGMVVTISAVGSLTYYASLQALDRSGDSGSVHAGFAAVPLRRVGPTPNLVQQLLTAAGQDGRIGARTGVSPTAHVPASDRLGYSAYYVVDAVGNLAGTLDSVATQSDFVAIVGRSPSMREWRVLTHAGVLQLGGAGGHFTMLADQLGSGKTMIITNPARHGNRISVGPGGPQRFLGPQIEFDAHPGDPVSDLAHTDANFLVGPSFVSLHHVYTSTDYLYVWTDGRIDPQLGDRVRAVAESNGIAANEVIFDTGGLAPLPFDWRLILITAEVFLWVGIGIAVLAMSEDGRPFYQSLFALGFASWRQRIVLAVQAALIAAVAMLFGIPIGLAVGRAAVLLLDATAPVTTDPGTITFLTFGAIAGAALIGALRAGQRSIDELSV